MTNTLLEETESARLYNIDAEQIIGMLSAAKEREPASALCFMTSVIKGKKNNVVDFQDNVVDERKEEVTGAAMKIAKKQGQKKRLNSSQLRDEILRREGSKQQKMYINIDLKRNLEMSYYIQKVFLNFRVTWKKTNK